MNVYLDASVLVSLFIEDAFSDRADRFFALSRPALLASDFMAAEFASVIARRVRTGELTREHARTVFSGFDHWTASTAKRVETTSPDIARAESFIRRLDLTLRAPDALNIAIAERANAELATFDEKMAAAAAAIGVQVAAL